MRAERALLARAKADRRAQGPANPKYDAISASPTFWGRSSAGAVNTEIKSMKIIGVKIAARNHSRRVRVDEQVFVQV